ncbi:MAG: hypothetical protein KDB68_11610 [Planctomycetes bacterium]|nr:hypothetical protein [Planctomycetota bacterium]
MRKWHEYMLKVRPYRDSRRGAKKKRSATKLKAVQIIARSKLEAELFFRNDNPKMMVIEAKRGKQVDPPDAKK